MTMNGSHPKAKTSRANPQTRPCQRSHTPPAAGGTTPRAVNRQGDKALPATVSNQPEHSHGQSRTTT